MFPLRDTIRSRSFPVVTYSLIAVNTLIFLFEASLGPRAFDTFMRTFALIPARLNPLQPASYMGLFTSMFLHGSWFHLISNMWTLYIFGDNVEDRMGGARFLLFYLLAGLAAGAAHVTLAPRLDVPTVGASGAIAGVLGAYFVLFPRSRVITFIPFFFLPWFIEVPAVIYLGIWFFSQLSSGLLSLGAAGYFGGIAWWAHIGGFLFGLLFVRAFARRERAYRWYPDEYWPW